MTILLDYAPEKLLQRTPFGYYLLNSSPSLMFCLIQNTHQQKPNLRRALFRELENICWWTDNDVPNRHAIPFHCKVMARSEEAKVLLEQDPGLSEHVF